MLSLMKLTYSLPFTEMYSVHVRPMRPVIWKIYALNVSAKLMRWSLSWKLNVSSACYKLFFFL